MKPILFSTPMVQAILEGRKTQTRRTNGLEKLNTYEADSWEMVSISKTTAGLERDNYDYRFESIQGLQIDLRCPYGKLGDILWVRETWRFHGWIDSVIYVEFAASPGIYHAVPANYDDMEMRIFWERYKWKKGWISSLFLPKRLSRLFLKITDVRVEQLHEITEADVIAEGIKIHVPVPGDGFPNPKLQFWTLWETINGIGSWKQNPWVWVITFERCEKPETWPS